MLRIPLLLVFLSTFLHAEVVTLVAGARGNSTQPALSSKTITLAEGDVATTDYLGNSAILDVTIGTTSIRLDNTDPQRTKLPVIAGPATVRLLNFSTFYASLATISIKRANAAPAPSSQVVVIPNDGNGNREVILESSIDMVTWNPTLAGVFDQANAARFFRVRIAKVSDN